MRSGEVRLLQRHLEEEDKRLIIDGGFVPLEWNERGNRVCSVFADAFHVKTSLRTTAHVTATLYDVQGS